MSQAEREQKQTRLEVLQRAQIIAQVNADIANRFVKEVTEEIGQLMLELSAPEEDTE
jgi:hypothetical protein